MFYDEDCGIFERKKKNSNKKMCNRVFQMQSKTGYNSEEQHQTEDERDPITA